MKLNRGLVEIFIIFLSFNIIYGNEFEITENIEDEQIFESFVTEGDIDKTWGAINNDSVRISIPLGFVKNTPEGTIAAWNVTVITSRIMDGIRLRSVNNTGAVGDIIDGGIGYNNVTFMLIGRSNYFYFFYEAYENFTSSLITSTPASTVAPVPDKIIREWGAVNYASQVIFPYTSFVKWSNPGVITESIERINSTKAIDGIRLTSRNNSVATGEILEGGIGFDFVKLKVVAHANFIDYLVTFFENGTYLQTREVVYGTVNNLTKLDEKRLQNYPQPGLNAQGNATFSTSGTILGIRLTYLNYTDGRYEITNGGLNKSSVTFDFKGPNPGEPYDFNIEIFGNTAVTMKLSIILVILSCIFVALFK